MRILTWATVARSSAANTGSRCAIPVHGREILIHHWHMLFEQVLARCRYHVVQASTMRVLGAGVGP